MKYKDILERAVSKAIGGGWNDPFGIKQFKMKYGTDDYEWSASKYHIMLRLPDTDHHMKDMYYPVEQFIFNQEFAKAIWGEILTQDTDAEDDYVTDGSGEFFEIRRAEQWKVKLREMVISPDPIKYLGKHLDA